MAKRVVVSGMTEAVVAEIVEEPPHWREPVSPRISDAVASAGTLNLGEAAALAMGQSFVVTMQSLAYAALNAPAAQGGLIVTNLASTVLGVKTLLGKRSANRRPSQKIVAADASRSAARGGRSGQDC